MFYAVYANQNQRQFIIALCVVFAALFSSSERQKPSEDLKTEIKEYISHHLEDAYDFSLFSYTNASGEHVYIGIPFP